MNEPIKNKCPHCHGTGSVLDYVRAWTPSKGIYKMVEIRDCGYCSGTGKAQGD